MKKRIFVLLIAMIIALGVVEVASAATSDGISINFTFTNMRDALDTPSGSVTNDASSYYVILNSSSTVASNNVFGFRARKGNGSAASSYKTMDYAGKKTVSYRSDVEAGNKVYLRCKKDDSSTYGGPLNAWGTFIP